MRFEKRSVLAEIFGIMGDALAAAAAIRVGRQPDARHLARFGIDAKQLPKLR